MRKTQKIGIGLLGIIVAAWMAHAVASNLSTTTSESVKVSELLGIPNEPNQRPVQNRFIGSTPRGDTCRLAWSFAKPQGSGPDILHFQLQSYQGAGWTSYRATSITDKKISAVEIDANGRVVRPPHTTTLVVVTGNSNIQGRPVLEAGQIRFGENDPSNWCSLLRPQNQR